MSHFDLRLIAERLAEIGEQLEMLRNQKRILTKEGGQPSVGLLGSIQRLEAKQANFLQAQEIWRAAVRAHPNI